jgi:hypothetical protein
MDFRILNGFSVILTQKTKWKWGNSVGLLSGPRPRWRGLAQPQKRLTVSVRREARSAVTVRALTRGGAVAPSPPAQRRLDDSDVFTSGLSVECGSRWVRWRWRGPHVSHLGSPVERADRAASPPAGFVPMSVAHHSSVGAEAPFPTSLASGVAALGPPRHRRRLFSPLSLISCSFPATLPMTWIPTKRSKTVYLTDWMIDLPMLWKHVTLRIFRPW